MRFIKTSPSSTCEVETWGGGINVCVGVCVGVCEEKKNEIL